MKVQKIVQACADNVEVWEKCINTSKMANDNCVQCWADMAEEGTQCIPQMEGNGGGI